jgi:hypothetical protein
MTNYYLGANQGAGGQGPAATSGVTTGTSALQVDFYVGFGAGNQGIAQLSRSEAIRALHAFAAYLRKDGNSGVAAVIPFGSV